MLRLENCSIGYALLNPRRKEGGLHRIVRFHDDLQRLWSRLYGSRVQLGRVYRGPLRE